MASRDRSRDRDDSRGGAAEKPGKAPRRCPDAAQLAFDVSGKVIAVTGGTQGLGKEIARQCAVRGAAGVVIAARRRDTGEAAAAELRGAAPRCRVEFVEADVGEVDGCRAVVRRCDEVFGRVDGVVNSAACTSRGTLATTSVELWDMIQRVNVRGPFLITQAAAELMRRTGGGGCIVNISSVHAHGGAYFTMPYAVSKAALDGLTRLNAWELQTDGIRVNSVNLGWTLTEQENSLQVATNPGWLPAADVGHPMGRLLRPGDAAGLVGFLLSDAAVMMTGSCIDLHPEAIRGTLGARFGDT